MKLLKQYEHLYELWIHPDVIRQIRALIKLNPEKWTVLFVYKGKWILDTVQKQHKET